MLIYINNGKMNIAGFNGRMRFHNVAVGRINGMAALTPYGVATLSWWPH